MAARYALLSVSDKTGLVDFAKVIAESGFGLLSTGGTARALREAGLEVEDVSEYTGFPEMLDGRVKTLHPLVHGGLLGRRDLPEHVSAMQEHGIRNIDLVVVNLYPFAATIAKPDVTLPEAIEQIDIGGPSMLRSAAKNHAHVTVVCDPADYAEVGEGLRGEGLGEEARRRLAAKVYAHTANYDAMIAGYMHEQLGGDHAPETFVLQGELAQSLRYGENPHQGAAFYRLPDAPESTLGRAKVLGGKELSYNNILDLDAALELAREFPAEQSAFCAIIKHGNPCGSASAKTLKDAFVNAHAGDPISAFGSIIACNMPVDAATASEIAAPGKFVECLIAPSFAEDALEILRGAKFGKNLRMIEVGPLRHDLRWQRVRSVSGAFLVQDDDAALNGGDELVWDCKTERQPTGQEDCDLRFAWNIVKHVRSNAILIAKDSRSLGVGAGQMSRVDSVRIAVERAGDEVQGSVLASDAFFPFPDGVEAAAKAGVTAIVQPGGSRNDPAVLEAANVLGITMIFTGRRRFRH
jgi:phosphoribosylaminoimidazolecarboxamide formyltransferase/IMP cyclohydrolase